MARVLVVDDDSDVVRSLCRLLGRHHEVIASGDLDTVWRELAYHDFDVVILDLSLGGSDGRCVVRALENRTPRIPIIVLSGTFTEARDETLGHLRHLEKPVGMTQLLHVIEEELATAVPGSGETRARSVPPRATQLKIGR